MADPFAPKSLIINSLASGEVSPSLYGRTDLAKFHQGAFVMRNFLVDYKGGAKTRPGDQFMGFSNNSTGITRIYPFKFSATVGQTYILVFTNNLLEFIKNPGGLVYPNSSNSGFIISAGVHYTVTTPYAAADLATLKFSQIADVLTITHPNYPRYTLSRISDTNWTLAQISDATVINAPTVTSITITGLPAGSTDPQTTRYIYAVSAVDADGNESAPSPPFISGNGVDIGVTQGSVSVYWNAVSNAQYYKVYKGLPAPGNFLPQIGQSLGFCGYAYGTNFVDSNIVPDFTRTPLLPRYPFAGGSITGYNISAPGTGYPNGTTGITVTGGSPTRPAVIYAINGTNTAGGTSGVVGLWIADPGEGYTSAPAIAATGGGTGFAGTVTVGSLTGVNPAVSGLFQQRQVYANIANNPNAIFASRTGAVNDFRTTNPTVDSDALSFDIASPQVNSILWMRSMPGGLVIGTDSGIVQLTGGSASATNPLAVTPSSAVIVPQSYFGSADVEPIVINYDIIYVQSEGGIVRDLQYNFFVNIYTGTDITILSTHLFYPNIIKRMAYQDTPLKTIWCIRSDGLLLSLAFLKEQEVMGWSRHDTAGGGAYEDVAVVQENNIDAVYFVVNRGGTRFITRLCDQIYNQIDDAWCLDAALSTVATYPSATITASAATGNVIITANANVFAPGDVGKVIRYLGGRATVTGYTSATVVAATIDTGYPFPSPAGSGLWRLDPKVSTVGGLSHLNGYSVMALADGVVQGPFVVASGSITLTTPASSVVVGLLFQAQLQPLYADIGGEVTIAGRLKKLTAATLRVKDTARIKFGTDFSSLREFQPTTVLNTDVLPNVPIPGLILGDIRQVLNQTFNRIGAVAIQQDYPLPAHILAVIPEIAQGDTA